MDVVVFSLSALIAILLLIAVCVPVAERFQLPLPVVISATGLGLGALIWSGAIDYREYFLDTYDLWFVKSLSLDSQTLLLVFLPPLLYEMALSVNVRRLYDDAAVVVVMAIVAVLFATIFIGLSVWVASPISLVACMLLGAAVSTTDPAAVITTFRDIGAPRRLLVILEGESLLNDAAAIAIFGTLVALARAEVDANLGAVLIGFLFDFSVGATTGIVLGWLATALYRRLAGSAVAEATITVALAYGSYLMADHVLGASGVVSVVFAGLTTTSIGTVHMGPRNWLSVQAVWSQIGFWSGSTILLIAAALAPALLLSLQWFELLLVLLVYVGALAARALVLFAVLPALARAGLSTPMTLAQKSLVLWGGVRGAVTLVLAITLGEMSAIDENEGAVISALAAGYVFLTLMINAATLRLIAHRLGLDRLSDADVALRERIVAGTIQDIRDYVVRLAEDRSIEPEAVREMREAYEPQLNKAVEHEDDTEIPFGERLRLGLAIVANQEVKRIERAFQEEAIGPRITRLLRANAESLADAARSGGRNAYEAAAEKAFLNPGGYRIAGLLQRYLRFDRPLRTMLARRLTLLLETESILKELRSFISTTLETMIGKDAADNLAALIEWREQHVRNQIMIISRQYPSYTEDVERILLLRAAARREATQYHQLLDDGIVGIELFRELSRDLVRRRQVLDTPPLLDLGLTPLDLVRQMRLFGDLSEDQRQVIARHVKTQFAFPGDRIVSAGERGNTMYFVASGVLEVRGVARRVLLSNGNFFGELALVAPTRKRRTSIMALSYCRLLTLTRRDFRRLTSRDPAIEATIKSAAERQLGQGFRDTSTA